MKQNTHFSIRIPAFHGRKLPEVGVIVGYTALIENLELPVPIPTVITLISDKNKKYRVGGWQVHNPEVESSNLSLATLQPLNIQLLRGFLLKVTHISVLRSKELE